jgi:hypothetical protein
LLFCTHMCRREISQPEILEEAMDLILIVLVVFLLFGGGGYWGYRRWR